MLASRIEEAMVIREEEEVAIEETSITKRILTHQEETAAALIISHLHSLLITPMTMAIMLLHLERHLYLLPQNLKMCDVRLHHFLEMYQNYVLLHHLFLAILRIYDVKMYDLNKENRLHSLEINNLPAGTVFLN